MSICDDRGFGPTSPSLSLSISRWRPSSLLSFEMAVLCACWIRGSKNETKKSLKNGPQVKSLSHIGLKRLLNGVVRNILLWAFGGQRCRLSWRVSQDSTALTYHTVLANPYCNKYFGWSDRISPPTFKTLPIEHLLLPLGNHLFQLKRAEPWVPFFWVQRNNYNHNLSTVCCSFPNSGNMGS